MKEEMWTEEVSRILQEAPPARQALLDNYSNLLNVADYCQDNYLKSGEASVKALEETKNFTTQSLASVAYQISSLANSIIGLLDAQANQLRHMESSINLIGETVAMHREKVSRREIGVFTTVKRAPRSQTILPPAAGKDARPKYNRCPINYCSLDSLGHGVKDSGKQLERTGTVRKHGGTIRSTKPPEPVQCPVAPSNNSSFGKPVAPPSVPTWPSSPECDIITTLLDEAPPPSSPLAVVSQDDDDVATPVPPPPPPDSLVELVAPPPPPPPSAEVSSNPSTAGCIPPPPAPPPPPMAPPICLETVVEENSFPPPSPPPPPSDDVIPPLANEGLELPAPPPPPPPSQEVEALQSRRSRVRRPPTSRSLSLRVRSGPASRCLYTRSLFLPAVQSLMIPPPPPYPPPLAPPSSSSPPPRLRLPARLQHLDLEIPAPPPPPLLDSEEGCDDIMPPLPPPVDYETSTPPEYLEKVVALYSYEAAKPDDVSFTEGDVIYLTHRHDDGWCEGVVNGNQGFFPGNYIQSCD